jgi:hypothetical protein
MKEQEYFELCHKLLNRLTLRGRKFTNDHCVPDGLMDILMIYNVSGEVPNELLFSNKLSYDYDYFAFTKATKSLMALKCLLKDTKYCFNEDAFMIIRSIFECHIMSRYVREHINIENERKNIVNNFIINPLAVTFNHFSMQGLTIVNDDGEKAGNIKMPNGCLMGMEKNYYSEFYQFLCQYTHCSFRVLSCYFDETQMSYDKQNFRLFTILAGIFVYTKLYEGVVTVDGEDLGDRNSEIEYYNLAYDSIELQLEVFDYLIEHYTNKSQETVTRILEKYLGDGKYENINEKMVDMLRKMKESLNDKEIGSLYKVLDANEVYDRQYPDYY